LYENSGYLLDTCVPVVIRSDPSRSGQKDPDQTGNSCFCENKFLAANKKLKIFTFAAKKHAIIVKAILVNK